MTDEQEFSKRIFGFFKAAGIPYMLTGSVAAGIHGDTRATNDVDIVIDPTSEQLDVFLASLPTDVFYVDAETARESLRRRDMFNVIEFSTGMKADLIMRKARPFSEKEFERRQTVRWLDEEISVVSPEDVILAKLEWSRLGESERQYRDALAVARVHGEDLDGRHLRHWADELGIGDQLRKLLVEAGIADETGC